METNFYIERIFPCGCKATYSRNDKRTQRIPVFVCSEWKKHKYDVSREEERLALGMKALQRALNKIS